MATNSLKRVQHRCGTCGALLGSMSALTEHAKEHDAPDVSPWENGGAFDAWPAADVGTSTRGRRLGGNADDSPAAMA